MRLSRQIRDRYVPDRWQPRHDDDIARSVAYVDYERGRGRVRLSTANLAAIRRRYCQIGGQRGQLTRSWQGTIMYRQPRSNTTSRRRSGAAFIRLSKYRLRLEEQLDHLHYTHDRLGQAGASRRRTSRGQKLRKFRQFGGTRSTSKGPPHLGDQVHQQQSGDQVHQ